MAETPKKDKKEKKEKKHASASPRPELALVPGYSEDKLNEIRLNGLQCKLALVTVYNDQAELTYDRFHLIHSPVASVRCHQTFAK